MLIPVRRKQETQQTSEPGWLSRTEGLYLVIKGSVLWENITILNVYVPNNGAPKYALEPQEELDEPTQHWTCQPLPSETDPSDRKPGRTELSGRAEGGVWVKKVGPGKFGPEGRVSTGLPDA